MTREGAQPRFLDVLGRDGFPFSPFALVSRLMEDMDSILSGYGMAQPRQTSPTRGREPEMMTRLWAPQIEIAQRDDRLMVRADLPGCRRRT